jgi:FkbM family methyltransferase
MPLRFIPRETELPILQGPLRGRRWIAGSSTHGCWLGSYEYEKQRLFQRVLKPGDVVFDLGANVGFYTLLASQLVGPAGTVCSFEPLPKNLRYLRKHLELNRVGNVQVLDTAVGNQNGTVYFQVHSDPSMGMISDQMTASSIEVDCIMLDDAIINEKLRAPNVLKIDIEGAEHEALEGAQHTLREFHPTIFLATHGADVHARCCRMLRSFGYELRPMGAASLDEAKEILAVHE